MKQHLKSPWQQKWLKLEAWHADVQRMADAIEKFAKLFYSNTRDGQKLLVLSGQSGCGKTHCARALACWARYVAVSAYSAGTWPQPPSVHYSSWPEICDDFARDSKLDLMGDLTSQKLLVLDDVGAEVDRYKTGEMTMRLQIVLDRRTKLWTVITTNVVPGDWTKRWDARVADRLMRNSMRCDVSGMGSYSTR